MDLTVRPPVRRRTSAVVGIDPEGRCARGGNLFRRTTDPGHPDDRTARLDNGPSRTLVASDPGVLHAANHKSPSRSSQRPDAIARPPGTDQIPAGSEPAR